MTTPEVEYENAALLERARAILRQSADAMELSREACEKAEMLRASLGNQRNERACVHSTFRTWDECS